MTLRECPNCYKSISTKTAIEVMREWWKNMSEQWVSAIFYKCPECKAGTMTNATAAKRPKFTKIIRWSK